MKRLASLLNVNIDENGVITPVSSGYNNSRYKMFSNSRLWFAAFIPLLTMFIEMYANRFALGVLCWVCCVISWTTACLLDRRYLRQKGVDVSGLSPATAILPPLYIFKRVVITGDQNTAAIIFICFAFYAACANGFSQGIAMGDAKMIGQVRDNYWTNISNLSGVEGTNTLKTIGATIDPDADRLGNKAKAKWKAKRMEGIIYVTVKCGDIEIKFEETFDGFAFTDIKMTYFSDGANKVKYDKNGDNTVFKKYVEAYLKSKSKNSDSSTDSADETSSVAEDSAAAEDTAESKARKAA